MLNKSRCSTRAAQCSETSEQAADVVRGQLSAVKQVNRLSMLNKSRCSTRAAQCSETSEQVVDVEQEQVFDKGSSV